MNAKQRENVSTSSLIAPAIRHVRGTTEEIDKWQQDLARNDWFGYILFDGEADDVQKLTGELQAVREKPVLIAADLERGPGQKFSGALELPSHMSLGAVNDPDRTKQLARDAAIEARQLGINCIFAPVLDRASEPSNPIIQERAIAECPGDVGRLGTAFLKGLQEGGCLAVAKHFPGHGRTRTDSHRTLPVVEAQRNKLNNDIMPFRTLIEEGCPGMMISHVQYDALDPEDHPASLSPSVLRDLLREDLDYDGLVFSDALMMEGVEADTHPDRVLQAVSAGLDVLLYPSAPEEFAETLDDRMKENGDLTREQIKHKAGYLRKSLSPFLEQSPPSTDPEAVELSVRTAERGVTALGREDRLPSWNPESDVLLILPDPDQEEPPGLLPENLGLSSGQWTTWNVGKQAEPAGVDPPERRIWLAYFFETLAWKGRSEPRREILDRMNSFLSSRDKPVLLSFSGPGAVRNLQHPDRSFLFYGIDPVQQQAAARLMEAGGEARGTLPVRWLSRY